MAKGTTIRDVAARAGVSISTVSRVLNGFTSIAPDTSERVRDAIEALGFRPNRLGRSLKAARTHTIGVLVPSLRNPVFADCVAGIQIACAVAGYSVLIASSDYDAERERAAVETFLSHQVEGLILTVADADDSRCLDALDEAEAPYVLVYNQPCGPRPFVSVDNVAAARAMVERIVALGHRRVGMVAGRFLQSDRSRLRHEGYRAALADAGLPSGPLVEVDFADTRLAQHLAHHMTTADPPTALFGSNDMVALAVIRALRDLGLSVPDDVSVTGFDGVEIGALVSPSLATLVQPSRALGEAAFARLLDQLAGNPAGEPSLLAFTFRPGESLGPAPTRAQPQRGHAAC
ncbi:LacI family DNA-binding transcriptional regulator [Azospirillum sp. TSO22-1]|uniref:LacI family DNA-binding transcriptional regulator n=1 Tax=Azospirillum sp. TSO22-1 TaxID=716789 RepID=UPI000D60E8BE|nr:LacI family DNA-binding transcriptional regulator [Azospirillum sp. TSO22-1]PWC40339.1 alanine racemase [Azospirillum sp. TSO22-1]